MKWPSQFCFGLGVFLALGVSIAAQDPAPPATGPTTGGGGAPPAGSPGAGGGIGSIPGSRPGQQQPSPFPSDPRQQQQQRFPEMQRPIFLSGKVVMEDGTPPPEPVTIERICNGQPRPEGYTDSKGRFSFQLGQNQHLMTDASVSNSPGDMMPGMNGPGNMGGFGNGPFGNTGIRERDLMGCEIRAVLPGYRSEVVQLSGRRSMDNPDVGTIVLRRLANVEGLTLSATALAAPKDAKKAYEKAREAMKRNKIADAEKELIKAVTLYPQYANAWSDLGRVQEAQKKTAEARESYTKALESDSKLVEPYVALALIHAKENKWKECAELSAKAIKLNPFDYPAAYFYNAVANLNTDNLDEAEKSAREGLKSDGGKKIAKMHHVLGIILAQKNDAEGALTHLKGYLNMIPSDSPEVATLKGQIAQLEQAQARQQPKPAAGAAAQQQ